MSYTYVFDNGGKTISSTPELPPGVMQYDFPDDLAKSIVDFARTGPQDIWIDSSVLDFSGQQSIRTSMDCNFDYNFPPFLTDRTNEIINSYINHYNQTFRFANICQTESLAILRYGPGKWYDTHCDAHWKVYRVVSMLVYLNPQDYVGGETWFPHFNLQLKPDRPSIVFFPSNYIFEHQAMPVQEGEKMVLVTWMNDLPKPLHQESLKHLAQAFK